MADHLSFIRIRNLADSDSEVFQGIGAAASTAASTAAENGAGTLPPTPAEEKQAYDISSAWEAQNQFSKTLISFLSALDPGQNTDAGSLVTDFVSLLEATQQLDASVTAFDIQRAVLGELPVIWQTLNRVTPQETTTYLTELDGAVDGLVTWFEGALTNLAAHEAAETAVTEAETQLSAAATEEAATAAQTALTNAQTALATAESNMAAAENNLPAPIINLPEKMTAIVLLTRAIMTGNVAVIAVTLVRIGLPLLIKYLAKWMSGKLPGSQPKAQDLQPIVDALRDLALKDTTIRFGDHIEIHEKAAMLYES